MVIKKSIYFDNAATSIRSTAFCKHYSTLLKQRALPSFELVAGMIQKLSDYLSADKEDISFVFNSSYAINMIVNWCAGSMSLDSKIYISNSEHLSTINACLLQKNVIFFDIHKLNQLSFNSQDILIISSITNLNGYEVDLSVIKTRPIVVLDASQSIQHRCFDLKNQNIDYFFFTAHKFFGPNGIGVIVSKHKNFGVHLQNKNDWHKNSIDWKALAAWHIDFCNITKSMQQHELKLIQHFRDHFPKDNEYIEWINPDTNVVIFLLKTNQIASHDFLFYLEKNKVIARAHRCCSYSPDHENDSHNLFRVSLSHKNSIEEIDYFFKLIEDFKIFMCF